MSFLKQIQISESQAPKAAIGLLIFILAFGLFIVGYDQGQLFSLVQGEQAYNDLWVHEFSHDMRHAAGIPCH
ncbi:MAG: CbtB domain-containing protein [Nitrososphaeraceae archaeon]